MKSVKLNGKAVFPSKIVCVGRNYVEHIRELNNELPEELVVFIKPNSSLSEDIHACRGEVIHFEGEISFLVESGELKGVGFGLDLTKRAVQSKLKAKGLPWERAKAFDRSAVFSEFIRFDGDIMDLNLELYINGVLAQSGGCGMMLSKPDRILSEAKTFLSFEDGDLIMSGTPKGVGSINPGDRFTGKIFEKETLVVEGSWVVVNSCS